MAPLKLWAIIMWSRTQSVYIETLVSTLVNKSANTEDTARKNSPTGGPRLSSNNVETVISCRQAFSAQCSPCWSSLSVTNTVAQGVAGAIRQSSHDIRQMLEFALASDQRIEHRVIQHRNRELHATAMVPSRPL